MNAYIKFKQTEIETCAGGQFDPELAPKFIEVIKEANIK